MCAWQAAAGAVGSACLLALPSRCKGIDLCRWLDSPAPTAGPAPPSMLAAGVRETAGQPQDPWAHRDSMMKPWQDLVTHRILLRAEPSGSGGGGRGAAHAASAAAEGSPPVRLAKWVLPEDATVVRFGLDQDGVHVLQVDGPS